MTRIFQSRREERGADSVDNLREQRENEGEGRAKEKPAFNKDAGSVPLSENEAQLLAEPPVTLYVGMSEECEAAFRTLEDAGIGFRVVRDGREMPVADWGGVVFEGAAGVTDLVGALRSFEDALHSAVRQEVPELVKNRDPQLAKRMAEVRRDQLAEARAAMNREDTKQQVS